MKKIICLLFIIIALLVTQNPGFAGDNSVQIQEILKQLKIVRKELKEIKEIVKSSPSGRRKPGKLEAVISIDDDAMLGDNDAKITLVEFTDYQCPYCKRFFDRTLEKIIKEYVDTGKVRYVLRDLPLPNHPYAQKASEATTCAKDQGKFWEMHNTIFNNQSNLSIDKLKEYAKRININSTEFNECLDTGKYSNEAKKDLKDAYEAGISGTPSFVVGKTRKGELEFKGAIVRGAIPYNQFKQILDSMLAEAK